MELRSDGFAPAMGGLTQLVVNIDFDNYTTAQLADLVTELERKNEYLQLENSLFESFHARSSNTGGHSSSGAGSGNAAGGNGGQPGRGGGLDAVDDPKLAAIAEARGEDGAGQGGQGRGGKKKKGDKSKQAADVVVLLTAEQKAEIATRELEELRDELEKRRLDWGKAMDNLRAEMEEIEIGVAEIKKAMYEFKRDIVQAAQSERTGKIMAEKVIRYFEDKMRARDTTLEKIRLKNSTLKTQKNKLMLQLRQKEEMGEVLHAIDFDQLKIENHQYQAKIEERNAELLKLKMAAGSIVQVMNVYKRKLGGLEDESNHLREELSERRDLLDKLKSEARVVDREIEKASRVHRTLASAGREYRVPSVMEYVMLKAKLQDCETKARSWRRKVEIAQMSLARAEKSMDARLGSRDGRKSQQRNWSPVDSPEPRASGMPQLHGGRASVTSKPDGRFPMTATLQ